MLYPALSEDQTKGRHLGCGTFCVGSEGEIVITSEHLFPISKGTQCVAFRKLRPFESISHTVFQGSVERKRLGAWYESGCGGAWGG